MDQPASNQDLQGSMRIEDKSRDWRRIIPRRRSGDYSLPLVLDRRLSIESEFQIGDTLLSKFGFDEFVGASNAEFPARPIPEVFRTSDTDAVTQKVVPKLPALFEWLMPQVQAPWQSYTEVSRMGAPFYKPYDDKTFILRQLLNSYFASDFSILNGHAVQIGVRIQAEDVKKKRSYTFISADGKLYKSEMDRSAQKVKVWGHDRYPGRTRLVFNQGIFNLVNQPVDTALHDVYGRYPAFHHNMTTAGALVRGKVLAFDVSHMERLTARIVYERALLLGGPYGRFQHYMRNMPFLVPSDDWTRAFFVTCNYDAGWSVQFGSGNSAVAPSQKDIFMCLYSSFAEEQLGIPSSQSFAWVAQGGDDRLRVFNYGDDNFVWSPSGDEGILESLFAYMSQFLTIGREEPPRFLGRIYEAPNFVLAASSYLLRTYQNERGPVPPFRRFPYMGWVEKRKMYGREGQPVLSQEIFPEEDKMIKSHGSSWAVVLDGAAHESVQLATLNAERRAYFTSEAYLLGKTDYLTSHETKVKVGAIGGYTGFTPKETDKIIRGAIDTRWSSLLK